MAKLYWVVINGEDSVYADDGMGTITAYWVNCAGSFERVLNALKKSREYGLEKSTKIIIDYYLTECDANYGIYDYDVIDGVNNIEEAFEELDDEGYDWYVESEKER